MSFNPALEALQQYPFERLRALNHDVTGNPEFPYIPLTLGEPKHPPPEFVICTDLGLGGLGPTPPANSRDCAERVMVGPGSMVTGTVALEPPKVARTVVDPARRALTKPVSLMDRRVGSPTDQVRDPKGSALPLWSAA